MVVVVVGAEGAGVTAAATTTEDAGEVPIVETWSVATTLQV
jgi:hypothetical protein